MTGRYVRRGGPIPQIYPGTLDGLNQALKDCVQSSKFLPDKIIYLASIVYGEHTVIRQFKGGREWEPRPELGPSEMR